MNTTFHDAISRLAQAGSACGVQLVRLKAVQGQNRYAAEAVEFASDGTTQPAGAESMEVVNLGEPADQAGQLTAGTEAVALDVEGRWVVFVRPAAPGGSSVFPARVVSAQNNATYVVIEQDVGVGGLADKNGASQLYARNLAELSLGTGAAVDVGAIVLVLTMGSGAGATYWFDHPAYAKYMA